MHKFVLAFALPVLLAGLLLSQGPTQPNAPPIEVSQIGIRDAPNGPRLSFTIRNISGKPITAYVVVASFYTGGRFTDQAVHTSVGPSPRMVRLAPGQLVHEQLGGVPFDRLEPRVTVDYVLFTDGSRWGPDRQRFSLRVHGVYAGARLERARLRRLLKEKGAGALLTELSRESSPGE